MLKFAYTILIYRPRFIGKALSMQRQRDARVESLYVSVIEWEQTEEGINWWKLREKDNGYNCDAASCQRCR